MTKLRKFEKDHVLLKKTHKELRKSQTYKDIKLKKQVKTPYSRQKVVQLLNEKYKIPLESLKGVEIGPTSNQDVEVFRKISNNKDIFLRDKRLLFTILGVSGEQLRDAKLISDDVEKFLKRDQPEKALLLIKLSNTKKSVVAMNKLIEFYLIKRHDCNTALSLFNWRKKWGIIPNEESFTMLFDGISKLPYKISHKNASNLINIIVGLIQNTNLDFQINDIHFNSAMSALINSKDGKAIFELFDMRPKHVKKTAITYTILLKGLTSYYNTLLGESENGSSDSQRGAKNYVPNVKEFPLKEDLGEEQNNLSTDAEVNSNFQKYHQFFKGIVDQIPLKQMDDKLCYEMIYSLSRRGILENENKLLKYKILSDCCNGLAHYFDFKGLLKEQRSPEFLPTWDKLLVSAHSKHEPQFKKFKMNQHVIALAIDLLGRNGSYKKMDEFFQQMISDTTLNTRVTPLVLEHYFKNVLDGYTEICDSKMLDVLNKCDENGTRRVVSKEVQYLMNTAFLMKLQNAAVLRDYDRISSTFENFFKYYDQYGSINTTGHHSDFAVNDPSRKKWYIYFEMIKRAKFLEKFGQDKGKLQKYFLDEYIKDMEKGEFVIADLEQQINLKAVKFKKDIDLKAIMMLNHIIYDLNTEEANKQAKTHGTLLMRLKDYLLKRCTLMDVFLKSKNKAKFPSSSDEQTPRAPEFTFEQLDESIKSTLSSLATKSL
ncbi:hypothetical protein ACO0QE_004383 [Hanseniaspora vineae]